MYQLHPMAKTLIADTIEYADDTDPNNQQILEFARSAQEDGQVTTWDECEEALELIEDALDSEILIAKCRILALESYQFRAQIELKRKPAKGYQWAITENPACNDNETADTGAFGPDVDGLLPNEVAEHPEAQRFCLKNAEGKIIYYGYIVADAPLSDTQKRAPLIDFQGAPKNGCTTIEYLVFGQSRIDHKWIRIEEQTDEQGATP